jgi:predicted Zn finger-like uncharacterized protein
MALVTQCPNCDRKLRVPDEYLGKRVRCPACKEIFTASTSAETSPASEESLRKPVAPRSAEYEEEQPRVRRRQELPPDDNEDDDQYDEEPEESSDEDEPEPERRPRRRRDDWLKVQNGVSLVLVSISIILLTIPAGMVASGIAAAAQAPPPGGGPGQFQARQIGFNIGLWIGLVMGLASEAAALVGYFFCLSAPPKYGAKTLATVCLVLGGASVVAVVLVFVLTLANVIQPGGLTMGASAVDMVRGLLALSKFFVFLFFLRAIAKLLREESLGRRTGYLIILNGVFLLGLVVLILIVVLSVGALGVAAQQQGADPQAGRQLAAGFAGGFLAIAACGCGELILGLTSFVWYIVTLIQTRSAIARYVDR